MISITNLIIMYICNILIGCGKEKATLETQNAACNQKNQKLIDFLKNDKQINRWLPIGGPILPESKYNNSFGAGLSISKHEVRIFGIGLTVNQDPTS